MKAAYYGAQVPDFLAQSSADILGTLTAAHHFALEETQRDAWQAQIAMLKQHLAHLQSGFLLFEFSIPRVGKRADVVLLYRETVFVLEFKVGAKTFERPDMEQAHDYALDLKNFHRGSHQARLVPVLIATQVPSGTKPLGIQWAVDGVANPVLTNMIGLPQVIELATQHQHTLATLNAESWASSGYLPTPTIVEAARALYEHHQVHDIARSDAGAKNLAATHVRIAAVIENAKRKQHKAICFITGVPGAGKTLAGLNIATQRAAQHTDEHAVFLSGNGPLVSVLREALARDQATREGIKKKEAERKVHAFIQNIHHFRDECLRHTEAPSERVVIFDEAQRAWTREQASKFMQQKRGITDFNQSEPEFLIGVMDRHPDWCVIVCLIGNGQEINTGEAGLTAWLQALRDHYPHWQLHASSLLTRSDDVIDETARQMLDAPHMHQHADLHLATSMRSFRAETLNHLVTALLNGDAVQARQAHEHLKDRYPIRLTRDLHAARTWLRQQARGSERYGLVASSGAHRLRSEGIDIKSKPTPEYWFLNDRDDVRSSFYLEEAATEFEVQGLELDWACLAWDADLRWQGAQWRMFKFRGTQWQRVNVAERQRYLLNAYRVLLTRARQGLVIYVPLGDDDDPTRPSTWYAQITQFLHACGIQALP